MDGAVGGETSTIETFSTLRLDARLLRADDVAALHEIDQDPEVMRYLTGGKPGARGDAERRAVEAGSWTWLAATPREGIVGWFSLRPTGAGERELGYRLGRASWGMGYGTEGARRCVELAFTELGAERVWAQTMTVNVRSRAVMERVGMRLLRTFFGEWDEPIPGSDLGDVEYELTRSEWERSLPAADRT